jgi:UDP-N-acetyl-D-galactosamine dehydrogenase
MVNENKVAVIGLGYVGLPLAVEFGKNYQTIGFDINKERVTELINGNDVTCEVSTKDLKEVLQNGNLSISSNINDLTTCNIFIVTVPTPIDQFKAPDLGPLLAASKMLGNILKKGDIGSAFFSLAKSRAKLP